MVTESDVRSIALNLPGVYEQESYGGCPSWRTKPRMFAWIRDAPDAIVVWVDSLEAKEALLASDSDKFFTISHYEGQPIVLVHMETIDVTELEELVHESWMVRAPPSLTAQWLATQ